MKTHRIIQTARIAAQKRHGSYYDQVSLATRMNITQPHLSYLERGLKPLNMRLVVEFAEQLDLDLRSLLESFAADGGVITIQTKGMSPEVRREVCELAASVSVAA